MNESTIGIHRLLNQGITGSRQADKPCDIVRHLGAVQAQDYHQMLWAIGVRMEHASVADVEQAIENREFVLTWPMRGTIHAVPSDNLRWMLRLLTPRILAGDKRRLAELELTPEIIDQTREIVVRALRGNKRITRPDMMRMLEDAGIRTDGQRGYHLLWHLAQIGLICLGPREGKQQTFVLLEEWLPHDQALSREESLKRLTERYFASHGPATVQDYAGWAGLTLADARQGMELAQEQLVSVTFREQVYYSASSSHASGEIDSRPSVDLLPGFDEFILGYKNRADVLREEHAKFIIPGNNGIFKPTIVIDGQVAGIWKRTVKKRGIDIVLQLFQAHRERTEELEASAARYCEFMGLPIASLEIQVMGV